MGVIRAYRLEPAAVDAPLWVRQTMAMRHRVGSVGANQEASQLIAKAEIP
jgi:hypothetical protein